MKSYRNPDVGLLETASARFPTRWGMFRIYSFELEAMRPRDRVTAIALVMGKLEGTPPLVRLHAECLPGDVFGSCRCDCGEQLQLSLSMIAAEQRGVVVYGRQETEIDGLMWKLRAYELQDQGLDAVDANVKVGLKADSRYYELAARILRSFRLDRIRLLTGNPLKVRALEEHNIEVVERISCEVSQVSPYARGYLQAKKARLGHFLSVV